MLCNLTETKLFNKLFNFYTFSSTLDSEFLQKSITMDNFVLTSYILFYIKRIFLDEFIYTFPELIDLGKNVIFNSRFLIS
jgi:hypothetical protein